MIPVFTLLPDSKFSVVDRQDKKKHLVSLQSFSPVSTNVKHLA